MELLHGTVASLFLGAMGTRSKEAQTSLEFAFDGIVGDRHRGLTRKAWEHTDKQPGGTERRNERQWSAVAHSKCTVADDGSPRAAQYQRGQCARSTS